MLMAILPLCAATVAKGDAGASAQANNPLANMKALNFQNYYIGEVTGTDASADQFWVRYAQPVSIGKTDWLMRASLPINHFPTSATGGYETGLGDLNIFAAYLIDLGNPAISFGIGPQLTVPTAIKDALGSEKWSAGIANVLFNASSLRFQYGYLLTWQASFGGEGSAEDVNIAAFQPFAFYQLGGGTYLRAAPIWSYNLENDNYSMPIGVGVGQVIKKDKVVLNIFVEPQVSILDEGNGLPEWQVYMGLNIQFLN
ncbi:hypothetical protein P4E94_05770 [Pontiellaceae bacterium B12219]|nr:hypothetical protein [Pontiellaceae bacterium B12219]